MANTITDLANVYSYRREAVKQNTESAKPQEQERADFTEKRIVAIDSREELVSKIEKLPQAVRRNLEFSVDEETGQRVVRVIDSDTKELVRQIPPEQILRIIQQMEELQGDVVAGVLLDNSV